MILFLFVLYVVGASSLSDIFHNAYSLEVHPLLRDGGFLYYVDVLTSSMLQSRSCLIHYNDSKIYVNYDVSLNGESSAFIRHPVLGPMEYFVIGDFSGMLPVILNVDYINSFNVPQISCVIGLGAGNTIFESFRITPQVLFSKESNSGTPIACDAVTNELCSFTADIYYGSDLVGSSIPVQLTDFTSFSSVPADVYAPMYFDSQSTSEKAWKPISICASSDSCFYISPDIADLSIHEYQTISVRPYNGTVFKIGLTALYALDIAYANHEIRVRQRGIALAVSFNFQFFNIVVTIIAVFLISTPPVRTMIPPSSRHLFDTFKTIVQIITLVAPFIVLIADNYFAHLHTETHSFVYFAYSYQCVITFVGIVALLTRNRMPWMHSSFMFLPLISVWNLLLFNALIDFIEGNPTWGQVVLFQFISTLLYTFAIFILYEERTPYLIRTVLSFFWAAVATTFVLWCMTLFMIPPLQRMFQIFDLWALLFYPVFIALHLVIAHFFFAGMRSMLFHIDQITYKKNI